MALAPSGVFFDGARTIFGIDSTNSSLVPADGIDFSHSLGGVNLAGTTQRLLVNNLAPVGAFAWQTVIGAETNTFTSRVAIHGTLVSPTTYPTAPTAGTFPAGALNVLGRTIRVTGGGNSGTTGTPNWTLDFALGAAGASVVGTTGALAAVATTSPANFTFSLISTVTTIGASGVMTTTGTVNWASATNATATWAIANSTVGTGLTLDLTAAQACGVFATCGTSNASNRIRLTNLLIEVLA
jgi:hypothetical protein